MTDWREPYRSIDASGSPDSASQVGWDWLHAIIRDEHDRQPEGLELDHPPVSGGEAHHAVLYRDRVPVAGYFVVRDPMNFAQLFRWRAPDQEA